MIIHFKPLKSSLIVCFVFMSFSNHFAQSPSFQLSDTSKVRATSKWLNLQDWYGLKQNNLSLKYSAPIYKFDQRMYDPARVMPKDPFKIDYRSGSYYVPKMVRDELTHIMNRPKESAYVPVLGVAFLAAQLAAKYLILQEKMTISAKNILNSADSRNILEKLWLQHPQTISQLFQNPSIRLQLTMNELAEKVNLLLDNKLARQKLIDKDETQYFPAVTRLKFIEIIEKSMTDTSINDQDRIKLNDLLNWAKSVKD